MAFAVPGDRGVPDPCSVQCTAELLRLQVKAQAFVSYSDHNPVSLVVMYVFRAWCKSRTHPRKIFSSYKDEETISYSSLDSEVCTCMPGHILLDQLYLEPFHRNNPHGLLSAGDALADAALSDMLGAMSKTTR